MSLDFITPWLVTFGFGCVVFLVGRRLQANEKRKHEERMKKESARSEVRPASIGTVLEIGGTQAMTQSSGRTTELIEALGGGIPRGVRPERHTNQGYDA